MDLTDKNFSPKKLPDRKKRLAKGCTTLMYSCQQGKSDDIVTELRIKPKSLYQRDKSNKSALHYCCGQLDLVAAASITTAAPDLLESADEDGLTPLHLAVIQGNTALVNLLIANKANVNAVDNEGHSVVHWAAVCGEVEALRALLAAGSDITITDLNGGSPLHYAAQMSNGSGYQSHSANLALEILEIFLQQPNVHVDVCDRDGRQPLLWAASAGAVKAVLMLVKAGARVESADKDGLTALHCAASRGHTECINVLINLCGAPVDLIDTNGCTALHYAVTLGHADATYMLLDLGADPNRQDRKGRTPAHCGCAKGQFETVKLLRDRKANLWLRNAKGDLPLHEAASSGRRELVLWLLDQRPKHVNTTSNDGRTILHIAASNDYSDMCKMLIDFGADINAIFRLPGNVVQTPLDCALNKGHRSTAKFLQLHGGLPANKLRLSGRNPNALNDQELVKPLPLTFSGEKKRPSNAAEQPNKATRSVWLYVDQSESDDDADAEIKPDEKYAEEASQGKSRSRKSCGCQYHYHHHYRHRCRFRSNSCERIEILQRDSGPDNTICRSKSNVEICLYHKKKPRIRRDAKSTSSEHSTSDEESAHSSEHCHRSYRRKRDSHRSKDRAKVVLGKESDVKEKEKEKTTLSMQMSQEKKENGKKDRQPASKDMRVESEKVAKTVQSTGSQDQLSQAMVKSPEKIGTADVVKVGSPSLENAAKKSIVTIADVHTPSDSQEAAVTSAQPEIAKVVSSESVGPKMHEAKESKEVEATQLPSDSQPLLPSDQKIPDEKKSSESSAAKPTEPSSVQEAKPEQSSVATISSPEKDAKEGKETMEVKDVKEGGQKTAEDAKQLKKAEQSTAKKDQALAIESAASAKKPPTEENKESKPSEKVIESKDSQSGDAKPSVQINDGSNQGEKETDTADDKNANVDASTSFQVLPSENQPSDNLNQELDDTGNLGPPKPPTETIRKTSFTVLKSDESIDDLLAGMDENQNKEVTNEAGEKTLTRPKSFKVLKSHDPSGEDIILHQSSDQEVGGDANFEDYLNRNLAYGGGKYSDSELVKSDGQFNGRRKKYKKRAKSVKQLTIVDGLSKDQDSGFEPSPRTLRSSQKNLTTRAIYTAGLNMPERPRVGDTIIDGRSISSRFDAQRKLGDKNACNMATVSQTLQRNIRRYYMEHKIFQHLLELKSLQIRSSKVNESLLVKRAVDDYHKSTMEIGSETGSTLRRYPYKEYTFKNFEIFLYEVLKSLQKNGSNNFQNISDVYLEAERRLSPDYSRCKKAIYCTSKTHRCLHAAHAYTGIPCAAYIPMMNHHTMPKYGFGKTSMGSFYLPKICTKGGGISGSGKCGSGNSSHNTVSLELSHGSQKQLITLPAEKLDNNKRYYVTFTLKENEQSKFNGGNANATTATPAPTTTADAKK
ncbi:ankycorbin [Sitodiplosis mosellana]|uniref:ankycorbin n=1 Tax=Sitodiplosis mosellana TaxID=263140 RepID=UPI00244492A8|nr:ankycorbin [Sitodiplosis mosellana]XP_055324549.1 ankycorbin [Sitodiplosis mosellana]